MSQPVIPQQDDLLVRPFPRPGPMVELAYWELDIATGGTPSQLRVVGDPKVLPRPWEPASCRSPRLRLELWSWLDAVVAWLNVEYSWDAAEMVPTCWPKHPHLVHEIAVLADQRRRAELALDSELLEEWHRNGLPAFTGRMRTRLKQHCDDGHRNWPGTGRHARHAGNDSARQRAEVFAADIAALPVEPPPRRPHLGLLDLDSGEVTDLQR